MSLVWLQPCVAADLTSTYQPSLQVVIDKTAADSSVVLRAHYLYAGKKYNVLYGCNDGVCTFRKNHHKHEGDWTYFVEKLKKAAPDNATHNTLNKWYRDNKKNLTLSVNVTDQIKALDFSGQHQVIDYTLVVASQDRSATVTTTNQGEYDPLNHKQPTQIVFGLSTGTIKLLGALLAIAVTYIGFRYIPVSVHHH